VTVLEKILYKVGLIAGFYIDVCLEFLEDLKVVGHNPSIVKVHTTFTGLDTGISSSINRKPILIECGCVLEILWKPFRALPVFHTWTFWIQVTTRPMHHEFLY